MIDAAHSYGGPDVTPLRYAITSVGAGVRPTGISATGHLRIVGDMVEAIRAGRAPLVPGEEGRRALAVVLAIYEAARTGQPVRPG